MRRISLALALVSAFAAGCSGGKAPSGGTGTGTAQGVVGKYFYVNLFTVPVGGIISSTAPAINCGASKLGTKADANGVLQYDPTYYAGATVCGPQFKVNWTNDGLAPASDSSNLSTVTLTAAPQSPNVFIGWGGDCSGTGPCVLTAGADRSVVAIFGAAGSGHPNFTSAAVHGPAAEAFFNHDAGALQCAACHGAKLEGQGTAPACASCHDALAFKPNMNGHFDPTAAAWGDHGTGWSAACQRCHTSDGYRDWVGVDGSANYNLQAYTGSITATLTTPPGGTGYANGTLKCTTCHNSVTAPTDAAAGITSIVFPSNVKVTTDKVTALCGQCHGARESTVSVNTAIGATAVDAQLPTASNKFKNPHYRGAAATVFGSVAQGWAQYPNQVYTAQNKHGVTAGSCVACHDAHTLEIVPVNAQSCGRCHFDETTGAPVTSLSQIEDQRQFGFEGDIDGNGWIEGLPTEINGLKAKLLEALQSYAFNVAGQGVCYSEATYPYFLNHATASGDCTAAEIATPVSYVKFTPRSYRAAYNLKFAISDSAAWAHNPRYAIEVLFDGILDLKAGLVAKIVNGSTDSAVIAAARATVDAQVPFTGKRSFNGHFGSAGFALEPYAQFLYHPAVGSPAGTPGTGFTQASCYQCHGGQGGFEQYLSAAPLSTNLTTASKVTGMACTTCHAPAATDTDMATLRSVPALFVPPQKDPAVAANKVVSFASAALPPDFALCATCHTGLENMASVDNKIATVISYSATGLVATAGTAASVTVAVPAPTVWAANRYLGARVTFTSGAFAGTSVVATASTKTASPNTAGDVSTISFAAIASAPAAGDTFDVTFDSSTFGLSLVNGHYFGAAGIILGTDAKVLYEYAGPYQAKALNWSITDNGPHGSPHGAKCTGCHNPVFSKHSFEINTALTVVDGLYKGYGTPVGGVQNVKTCDGCHQAPYALAPAKTNLQLLGADLLATMQAYAVGPNGSGKKLCYSPSQYPYYLGDTDGNGVCNGTELDRNNGYMFNAQLLKAAYNYQWFVKDPGAAEHNYQYIGEVLYDAIQDLGGVTTVARPAVVPPL